MSGIPMCPGCRALLEPGAATCPYCGWEIARTRVHRRGGIVERAFRPAGGVIPALILANVAAAILVGLCASRIVYDLGGGDVLRQSLVGGIVDPNVLVLVDSGANVAGLVLHRGEWWRLLASVFLHGGLLHIAMNLMALRQIGPAVEEGYGGGKALAVYLLCGLSGSLARVGWCVASGNPDIALQPSIGASGAIMGFVGVLAAIGLRIGGESGKRLYRPMLKAAGLILGLGILLSFTGSSFQIDNLAHAGGFLAGVAFGWTTAFGARTRGNPRAVLGWDLAALLLAAATAAAFVTPAIRLAQRMRG